jgi:multimeric flavodoxin WrbA
MMVSGPTKLFLDRWYPLSLEDRQFLKAKRAVCCLTYGADDVLLSGADTTARALNDVFTFLKVPVNFVHASAWRKGDIKSDSAALKRAYEAGKQMVK